MIRTFVVLVGLSALPLASLSENVDNFSSTPLMETRIDTSRVVDLDEFVVISQPKEVTRLRRQPLSSTVFTDRELSRLGIKSMSQLAGYVPTLAVPQYGSRLTSTTYIRGIGSRIGSSAVGVYYDNIPLVDKSSFNRHFYQTDRIDVLRGPQGTLYGINAEGGIIRMYSKNPMNYQGTDLRMGIATGLCSNVEVAHYHRPSEHFAFSTAVFYNGQKGFFRNTFIDKRADVSNEAGGKARLMWMPNDKLTLDLTADYQYVNQDAFPYGEYDNITKVFNEPYSTFNNGYRRQMVTTGLNVIYHLPSAMLSSTTSHQYVDDKMLMDQDYVSADYMRLEQMQKMNALTQEFTFRSTGESAWHHTSGIFFSHKWLRTLGPVYFGEDMNRSILSFLGMPETFSKLMTLSDNNVPGKFHTPQLNIGLYHESNISLSSRLVFTLGLRYDHQNIKIDYDTYSTFRLACDAQLMGRPVKFDSRYTSLLQSSTSEGYDQLLPKFALTYQINDSGNIYAVVSKGFRAGGYNLQMFSDIFQTEQRSLGSQMAGLMKGDMTINHSESDYENVNNTISYKPEESWNYEAGLHLNMFGGRVHADIAGFYMRIQNQQLSVMAGNYGYGRMMVNAGRSASCGMELTLRGSAFDDRLTWGATYGFTNSTFRNYSDSISSRNEDGSLSYNKVDYRGKKVPFIPAHTMSITADYRFTIATSTLHNIVVGANVIGNGPAYWDSDNAYRQDFYAVVGAHITLDFGRIDLDIWGRNLTDTGYNTFLVNSSADGVKRSFAQRGTPIQAGMELRLKF
ncbi:MAG: TonB-dependent receptor [Prevotella sp.]